jgi:TldD protein
MIEANLEAAVERMRDLGAQFCDARQQKVARTVIIVVDGTVRTMGREVFEGVCLRARRNGHWGMASSIDFGRDTLNAMADRAMACAAAGDSPGKPIPERAARRADMRPGASLHPDKVPLEEKLAAVVDLDRAQKGDPKVVNTNAIYQDIVRTVRLANSFGDDLRWEEVRTRLFAESVASEAGAAEFYYDGESGSKGFEMVKGIDLSALGGRVAREAVVMLTAGKAPSGPTTVISDPMISGLLAHEVMGHASEADEAVKKRSFLSEAVGRTVASEQITMVDQGDVPGAYGMIPCDDEGTPPSRTVIIENGVYKGFMHSLETAAEMGVAPTGNGRAQDHNRHVFVRMTSTFFEKGTWSMEEMLEGVKEGVLTDKMINGMEDPVGGGFEGKSLRGFLIKNGRVQGPVRSFTLTGSALEILRTTDAVGREVVLDGGTCGKGIEDLVPVSSGGPFCRSRINVGGG